MSVSYAERTRLGLCGRCSTRPRTRGAFCEPCYTTVRRAQLAASAANRPRAVNHPWTDEETEEAQRRRNYGETYEEIGAALKRTIWSVKNRLSFVRCKLRGGPFNVQSSALPPPHPGVERCCCGLTRDKSHRACDMAETAPEHVQRFMVRPNQ